MNHIRTIFNNREIAVGTWILITLTISLFTKSVQQLLKSILPIIFCSKFIKFYIIFLSFFIITIYYLYWIEFWETRMLKDTIFWIVFVEIPLFVNTMEKAKDNHFFSRLVKDNIALIVIIEFVINFWTFNLIIEFILVPVSVLIAFLYVLTSKEKNYLKIKKALDSSLIVFTFFVIIYTIKNLIHAPLQLFNFATLKDFILPILLLFFNLPVVYGLALYNTYEQLFIRVRGTKTARTKIKWKLFLFAGINLSYITAIRNSTSRLSEFSIAEDNLKDNLAEIKDWLSIQIGENYMKRSYFYIRSCLLGLVLSIIGLILSNSQSSVKDIIKLSFTLDATRIKDIITYICSTGFVLCICLLFFSIGLKKKKNEEISQIKKLALYELLYLIKRQHNKLKDFPPLNNPIELYYLYITTAFEIRTECDKSLTAYSNLMTNLEKDIIGQLQLSALSIVNDIGLTAEEFVNFDSIKFEDFFNQKVKQSVQNENINIFIHSLEMDIKIYTERINLCYEEFTSYM